MDSSQPLVMSHLLMQTAKDHIEELEYVKENFERHHPAITEHAATTEVLSRLSALLRDVRQLEIDLRDEAWMVEAIQQCNEDPQHHDIISEARLLGFEKSLLRRLQQHRSRIDVSYLHANLLTEKLATQGSRRTTTARTETGDIGEDFEVVDTDPTNVLNNFKREAFSQSTVDTQAIERYLSDAFSDEDGSGLQNSIQTLDGNPHIHVDEDDVEDAILELLNNNGITSDTRRDLTEYSQSATARRQLAGILSMKSIQSWSYKNAEQGLAIRICSDASGTCRVLLEQGAVDVVFLHLLASRWAAGFRRCFGDFVGKSSSFRPTKSMQREIDRRSLYLELTVNSPLTGCGIAASQMMMQAPPPPPPLPDCCPPPPPPPLPYSTPPLMFPMRTPLYGKKKRRNNLPKRASKLSMPVFFNQTLDSLRTNNYMNDFLMARISAWETPPVTTSSHHDTQSKIIKTLAAECTLRQAFDGSASVSAFQFDSLSGSLPHDTIITVLRYMGMPNAPLNCFKQFLRANVNMRTSYDVTGGVRARTCGVPVDHSLGMLFTEVVMTLLEFAVRKRTGSYMYRLYDRCYFIGTREQTTMFADELSRFSQIMGMKAHEISRDGKLPIGLLIMRPEASPSGPRMAVEIDETQLTTYAQQLKTSLDACEVVLDWVRVWNDNFGTYAAHLFGPLAAVFDKSHREAVRAAHKRIYSIVLGGSDLTKCMTNMLEKRIGSNLKEAPDALEPFVYLPQTLGGLGLKNPLVTLSLATNFDSFVSDNIKRYVSAEDKCYARAAEQWASRTPEQHQENLKTIFKGDTMRLPVTFNSFKGIDSISLSTVELKTKEELFEYRESTFFPFQPYMSYLSCSEIPNPAQLYRCLQEETMDQTGEMSKANRQIGRLCQRYSLNDSIELTQEEIWTLNLYAGECFERYGTLEIWWAKGLPVEIYNELRGHKGNIIDKL